MPKHALLGTLNPSSQDLETLVARIHAECQAAQAAWSNALDHALNAGDALNEVQRRHVLIGWKQWLKDKQICVSTGLLYQQLARHRAELEAEMARVPGLSLRMARKLIAKPRNQGFAIHREMKLGADLVEKTRGTSLDSARELDALVKLNRGAPEGGHTSEVEQLVAQAAAGKRVSAKEWWKNGPPPCDTDNGENKPAQVSEDVLQQRAAAAKRIARIRGGKPRDDTDPESAGETAPKDARGVLEEELRHARAENIRAHSEIRELKTALASKLAAISDEHFYSEFERRLPASLRKQHRPALTAFRRALDARHFGPVADLPAIDITNDGEVPTKH